ncbi:DUF4340 domain-containing protein [Botrimarina hoheduenensis]|uniref:DUF4340 domain-containing protein n=1 Tax=Botrimarina hoheduenensis TaxID=2528000 RepID=A0A5C5VUY7_9BACT|nr:DUF4340 domain-containing protein [Botrimarina hoheduenensis]TWT42456.1 hypothetical protein Pla111_27610 [Botrimarina hoheduenensis]
MKESSTTLAFLGTATLAVLIAIGTRPSDATYEVDDLIGKPLTKAFTPEEAKSLKILSFNEETATLREFEVTEADGVWSIPSQGGYPADAEQQMADASTAVMDREVLAIVSQSAGDHPEFGVVEPSPNLQVGQTGVGKRVTLAKGDGTALVDLIIGKQVKDEPDQRYVRRVNQDVVYIVDLDDASLSTKFEDWIEDDLLDLSPFDIERVRIKDYTAELVLQGFQPSIEWDRRTDMTLRYDDSESKWQADKLLAFDTRANDYRPFDLSELEQLNDASLGELKSALDDLRIVDVERKPAGLSADLRAGEDFLNNRESVGSLVRRGFAPVPMEDGQTEILSSEGEVVCSLKTGVEYVLRFGNLQAATEEGSADMETDPADPSATPAEGAGVNRYLFLSVRLNEDLIEKPTLEDLPELPEGTQDGNTDEAADTADDETPNDESNEADEDGQTDQDAADAAAPSEEVAALIAERKAIEERNQQALDSYQASLKSARERVADLNARFGDWYYVIANEVYKKIRLGRDKVITAKEPETDDATAQETTTTTGFGAPGAAIPGLPQLGLPAEEEDTQEDDDEEANSTEGAAATGSEDAPADVEPSANADS